MNDTQFTAADITYFPYILGKGLDEIKLRIDEMTRLGAPITLPILYQGKTKYLKCIRQYCVTELEGKPSDMAYSTIEDRLKR